MAGLIVIGAAIAYLALFWIIVANAKNWGMRVVALAVAIAIPFWELPFGYLNFIKHCKEEGGVHISKDFAPSTSILFDNFSYKPREVMGLGYDVVEYVARDKIVRYTKDGEAISEAIYQIPASKISYKELGWTELPWNLGRYDRVVVRLSDGKTIARQTDFSWHGLSWEMWLRLWITPKPRCPEATSISFLQTLPRPK